MPVQWKIKKGTELGARELYELLQLRVDVFTVEQDCPYQDLDGQDLQDSIYHLQAFQEGDPVIAAYLRIMYDGTSEARIGRVVVSRKYRSTGLGRALMSKALDTIQELRAIHEVTSIMLHGQAHLDKWYGSYGFEVVGEPFLEDNIPHLVMIKKLQ